MHLTLGKQDVAWWSMPTRREKLDLRQSKHCTTRRLLMCRAGQGVESWLSHQARSVWLKPAWRSGAEGHCIAAFAAVSAVDRLPLYHPPEHPSSKQVCSHAGFAPTMAASAGCMSSQLYLHASQQTIKLHCSNIILWWHHCSDQTDMRKSAPLCQCAWLRLAALIVALKAIASLHSLLTACPRITHQHIYHLSRYAVMQVLLQHLQAASAGCRSSQLYLYECHQAALQSQSFFGGATVHSHRRVSP